MQRLRALLRKFKVTIMVIPNADQTIRQKPINLALVFLVLMVLLVINIALITTSMISRSKAATLDAENIQLVSDMTYQTDKMNSLESINNARLEEILTLRETLESSVTYLDNRLAAIEEADSRIDTLVSMFNSETHSDVEIPISRSYDREAFTLTSQETRTTDDTIFEDIENLIENEEITNIIQSKMDAYDALIEQMETQLVYLDCRPDLLPASGIFTSKFGYRKDPITKRTAKHNGLDIANDKGTAIRAAGTGIITYSGYNGDFGNVIIIDHGYGYKSVYGHCSELLIEEGTRVEKGTLIAKMGSTGKSTGTHLHFEVRYNDTPINPATILNLE
ncbi:peptidoglycan DD-metalloendopeptidase family protein [Fusibacter paucivorans]|uniref:Peptidoglycan DD-metalloendopeptidase family protein n=1 Tax=Fusibacter paucivorans TaxID=76009 RepID=A0ABS5PQA5_9FIRM|nr:M23 family metallopeptidase [Fusibacter paucivorans]MBS7527348.1 peptidoglycan DD-metalloendopeptidase family protein [Fusibacter paucivorans]